MGRCGDSQTQKHAVVDSPGGVGKKGGGGVVPTEPRKGGVVPTEPRKEARRTVVDSLADIRNELLGFGAKVLGFGGKGGAASPGGVGGGKGEGVAAAESAPFSDVVLPEHRRPTP